MKKFTLMIALFVLAATLLTGCGSKPAEGEGAAASSVVGTWVLSSAELQGVEVPMDTYGEMTLEFAKDGTATFSIMGQSGSGNYTEENGKVTVDGGMELTPEDGNLVLLEETSGVKMIFTKK